MGKPVTSIVIVGGGTAGWLTAGTLAAAHAQGRGRNVSITLVESPTVNILGVGEGTWPSMRDTLKTMGIAEADFIRCCDASFKQGSRFVGWQSGKRESYYHPFTLPEAWGEMNLARIWPAFRDQVAFAEAVCPQSLVCDS
ncbi:MAG TPA: tryptophan 7-halogenase, partial [Cellvibrio sp.]|nr:tryptophan 7-halogenase [Cellvibrio sp.]